MKIILLLFLIVGITGCECHQSAGGIILDKNSKTPVGRVIINITENDTSAAGNSRSSFSLDNGQFNSDRTINGRGECPDLYLYFSKKGDQPLRKKFSPVSANDTVLLEKIPFNADISPVISLPEFDKLVDNSILLLKTKKLADIPDSGHIQIMMALNTIEMSVKKVSFAKRFTGGRYDALLKIVAGTKYIADIIKVYPKWMPNRGYGILFSKTE